MSEQKRDEETGTELLTKLGSPTGRRGFLKWTGAAAAVAMVGTACDDFGDPKPIDLPTGPGTPTGPATVTINFANDFGVLNYAYALEQLEAAFYTAVVASPTFAATFTATERLMLTDIRDHEIAHRDFLRAAIPGLGGTAIPNLTPNFGSVTLSNKAQVLDTARTFEDLGVAAYNGAGGLFSNTPTGLTLLTIAGKIVSVEARHASAIRDLISPKSSGAASFAPNTFDAGMTPQQVLAAADPFIVENVVATNVATIS
ncbi:MAG TPA: ferritin-like domain-containing protein [Longimicrobium sp.]|nr:ferritin-like domain-containing protein [Longimicrobium sp.]